MSEKPKEKPYTMTQAGGICFTSDRNKNPEIRVDNWIYDLWLPLLGATVMGVYTLYCRLDNGDRIWGMTLDDIARVCRLGKKSLMDINAILEECKFITIKRPSGVTRLKHFTTEIRVLTPPMSISPDVIEKFQHPKGYQPVTLWLVKDEDFPSSIQNFGSDTVLHETVGSSNQNYEEVLHETPMDLYLSRSIPLEDHSSMSAEPKKAQPTETGMDGWMNGFNDPKFNFLWDIGFRNEKTIQDLAALPIETLQKEWEIVKNSTVDPKAKVGILSRNLKAALVRFKIQQHQAAERAANPAAAQVHAHPNALAYQRPEFITEAEWYGLRDMPEVYELLDGSWMKESGSIEATTFQKTAALWMKYGDDLRQRFAACVAAIQARQEDWS